MTDVITLTDVTDRIVEAVEEAIEYSPETDLSELIYDVVTHALESWDWGIYTRNRAQLAAIAEIELGVCELDTRFLQSANRQAYQTDIIYELLLGIARKAFQ